MVLKLFFMVELFGGDLARGKEAGAFKARVIGGKDGRMVGGKFGAFLWAGNSGDGGRD